MSRYEQSEDKCRHCGGKTDRSDVGALSLEMVDRDCVKVLAEGEMLAVFRNGRWTSHGHTSAADLDRYRNVAPGYFHAIEDALRSLFRLRRELLDSEVRMRRELDAEWARVYSAVDEMRKVVDDEAARAYSTGRHELLKQWRSRSPVQSGETPDCLRDVRHVKQLEQDHPCHVYFLLRDGVVVYVGQTASKWPSRIERHVKEGDKNFDDVWYIEVDRQSLNAVEQAFIDKYRPEYNIRGMQTVEL